MKRLTALVLGVVLFVAGSAFGQRRAPEPDPVETSVSAESMPISVERVRRELSRQAPTGNVSLRLDYYVEVYGKTAALAAFLEGTDFTGPAPYGGPTHRDILNMITPQQFRAPAADIGALINWINQKLKERQKERDAHRPKGQ
jgi:hypothetical protein